MLFLTHLCTKGHHVTPFICLIITTDWSPSHFVFIAPACIMGGLPSPNEGDPRWMHSARAVWSDMISLLNQNTLPLFFSCIQEYRSSSCTPVNEQLHIEADCTMTSESKPKISLPVSSPLSVAPSTSEILLQPVAKQHGESLTMLTSCARHHFL